jgi:hypothetical protein
MLVIEDSQVFQHLVEFYYGNEIDTIEQFTFVAQSIQIDWLLTFL